MGFKVKGLPKNVADPFAQTTFAKELKDRLAKKTFPDQQWTSLCGPAAFFYCLQIKKSHLYDKAARELYWDGYTQIGNLRIKPSDACKYPENFFLPDNTPRISGLDWVTLASLRSSSNLLLPYDSPDDDTAAITAPSQLSSWFTDTGFQHIETFIQQTPNNFVKLNNYFKQGYCIVSLVSGGIISGQPSPPVKPLPTHWVVWSSTLNDKNGKPIVATLKKSDTVKLTVFSWGGNNKSIKNFTFEQFCKYCFQHLVFKG